MRVYLFSLFLLASGCGADSDHARFQSIFGEGAVRAQLFELRLEGQSVLVARHGEDDSELSQHLLQNSGAPSLNINRAMTLLEMPVIGTYVIRDSLGCSEIVGFMGVMPWHGELAEIPIRVYAAIPGADGRNLYGFRLRHKNLAELPSLIDLIVDHEGLQCPDQ